MSAELSDKMKLKLASFEAEAARAAAVAATGTPARTIEPDNTFRDKLKVFKSIETEAAAGSGPVAPLRRDSELGGPPPPRRDSDAAWLQRTSGKHEQAAAVSPVAGPMSSLTTRPAAVAAQPSPASDINSLQHGLRRDSEPAKSSSPQRGFRRESEPASSERLRDFPPFRASSSSALMNTFQNNKFFQQVGPVPVRYGTVPVP